MSPSRANNYIYLNQNMTLFTQLSRIKIYTYTYIHILVYV